MKRTKIFTAIAISAIAFTSCQKELEQGVNPESALVSFSAIADFTPETKTSITEQEDGKTFKPSWVQDDKIGFFTESTNGVAPSYNSTITVGSVEADGSAKLSSTAPAGEQTFFAYYPFNDDNNDSGTTETPTHNSHEAVKIHVWETQYPSATSFDGNSDILYAKTDVVNVIDGAEIKFNFKRATAVVKLNLSGLEGKTISKVKLSAPESKILTGGSMLNIKTGEIKRTESNTRFNCVSAFFNAGSFDSTKPIFFNVYPTDFTSGENIVITVEGPKYIATKTLTLKKNMSFNAGKVASIPVAFLKDDITPVKLFDNIFYETFDKTVIAGNKTTWDEAIYSTASGTGVSTNMTMKVNSGDLRTGPNAEGFHASSSMNNLNLSKAEKSSYQVERLKVGSIKAFTVEVNSMNGKMDFEVSSGKEAQIISTKPVVNLPADPATEKGQAYKTKFTFMTAAPLANGELGFRFIAKQPVRIDDIKITEATTEEQNAEGVYTITFKPSFAVVTATTNQKTLTVTSKVRNLADANAEVGLWYSKDNGATKTTVKGKLDGDDISAETTIEIVGDYTAGTYVTTNGKTYYSDPVNVTISETIDLNQSTVNIGNKAALGAYGQNKAVHINEYPALRLGTITKKTTTDSGCKIPQSEIKFTGAGTFEFYAIGANINDDDVPVTITILNGGKFADNSTTKEITVKKNTGYTTDTPKDLTIAETDHFEYEIFEIVAATEGKPGTIIKIDCGINGMGIWGIRFTPKPTTAQ